MSFLSWKFCVFPFRELVWKEFFLAAGRDSAPTNQIPFSEGTADKIKIPLLMKSRGSYPRRMLAWSPLLFGKRRSAYTRRSDRFQSGPVTVCAVRPLSRRAWLRRGKGSENEYLICKWYYKRIFLICQSFSLNTVCVIVCLRLWFAF